MRRSPLTPFHFHQNIALTLAAGAIAGRCYVQLPHDRIFPNLYTLLIARTSILAKTTAMNVANSIVEIVMPDMVTDSVSTPEAMLTEFSGTKPSNWESMPKEAKEIWERQSAWGARKLFILDEAGMLFNALRRDYNATLADLMMKLYDAAGKPIVRTTMGKGFISIQKYALSCLFGTTPAAIRMLLATPDAWLSGFWNRWNFVTQEGMTEWKESENVFPPRVIIETLRQVSNGWLSRYTDKPPYSVPIDKAVEMEFNQSTRRLRDIVSQSDDERIDGLLSRIPTKQMKAAMVLAVLESGGDKPRIKLSHWEECRDLAEGWHRDAMIAISLAERSNRITQEEKVKQLILRNREREITARVIQQYLHINAEETRKILESLEKTGQLKKKISGRKTTWTTTE